MNLFRSERLSSHAQLSLIPGRLILGISPVVVLVFRLTQQNTNTFNTLGDIVGWAMVIFGISFFIASFFSPFVKRNFYYFVIFIMALAGTDSINNLYQSGFDYEGQIGIYTLTFIAAWYLRSWVHLGIFQVILLVVINGLFFTASPDFLSPESAGFPYRYGLMHVAFFFLIGSNLRVLNRLFQQEVQYKDIFERLNEGIVKIDLEGIILLVNDRFCEILGYTENELLDKKSFSSVYPEEDQLNLYKKLQAWRQGSTDRYEQRLVKKNGEVIWVFISGSPDLDSNGRVIGSTSIISDITERKIAEEELDRYSSELGTSNKELELKNRELEKFADLASTDLKAPLRDIVLQTDKLKDVSDHLKNNIDNTRLEHAIEEVRGSSDRMSDLIDALLLYSLSSKKQFNPQFVDLNEILEEVSTSLTVHIQAHNVKIKFKNLPVVYTDKVQMIRFFRNLIENSIKYRGAQGPIISISFTNQKDNDRFIFTVEDNGIGIKREHYEEIFLVFQKGENSDNPGLGMGLAICKKIIDNHGGKLWLKSSVGQGTTFYFTLPYGPNQKSAQQPEVKEISSSEA